MAAGPQGVRLAAVVAAIVAVWLAPSALAAEATQIGGGFRNQCALTTAGGVKCWGWNVFGELGNGSSASRRSRPVDVAGLTSGVEEIAVGGFHACALTDAGGVKCWGYNVSGEIGDGTNTMRPTPVDVSGLTSGVDHIYAGSYHTCALLGSGAVKCWGLNDTGQIGDGSTQDRLAPVDVGGFSGSVLALDLGATHTCALLASGSIQCWGGNFDYELGDGTKVARHVPTPASALPSDASMLGVGHTYTCALRAGGGVKCLGTNNLGQLGAAGHATSAAAVDPVGLASGVEQIAASVEHTCVVTTAGGVKCWGANGQGELGAFRRDDHFPIRHRHTPTGVPGLASGIARVSAGDYHTCAVTDAGEILCWGLNDQGMLGDGTTGSRARPAYVLDFGATATATTVQSNRRPAHVGQWVRYTARISPATDLGRMRFTDGTRTIAGCGNVDVENGVARCAVRYSRTGTHRIRAQYLGVARLTPSRSPALVQRVLA